MYDVHDGFKLNPFLNINPHKLKMIGVYLFIHF